VFHFPINFANQQFNTDTSPLDRKEHDFFTATKIRPKSKLNNKQRIEHSLNLNADFTPRLSWS